VKLLKVLVPARMASSLTTLLSEVAAAAAVDTGAEPDDQGRVWVTVYCADDQAAQMRKRCEPALTELARRLGVTPAPKFEVGDVRADWETSWTQLLPPARLVPGLVLVAEGVDYEAAAGERVLRLEPGLYFGFGEHPTTQLISEWVSDHCRDKRVLDVGCGTGVLAFVAAFARAKAVVGIDIDAPSVQGAQRNAAKNGWQGVCTFSADALQQVSGQFDVVLANIDAKTLTLLAPELCRVMAPGGQVALTGVLDEQAAAVRDAFAAAGTQVSVLASREGWVLLTNAPAGAQLNEHGA
jgi:ribosomal protein L11 methyltransferase